MGHRLKAMITRAEVGQFITPFRLDFAYDYMGRRIMKRYSRYQGEANELVTTPSGDLKLWAADYEQRFVWDGGLAGGYGNLSASYFYDSIENVFAGADQSYAWGPDLSGSEQGAGGIGGLAIISAAASDLNPTAATYVPLYDGHGNVISLRDTSTSELAAYTYGPYGETTAAVGSRWASNPFRFSTKFTDAETGLVYYGYRYYMPSVGRWGSNDPVMEGGGVNLSGFVGNSPTIGVDGLGMWRFVPDMGTFDGALDPDIARKGAAFTLTFRPNKEEFACKQCSEVRFVQLLWFTDTFPGASLRGGTAHELLRLDSSNPFGLDGAVHSDDSPFYNLVGNSYWGDPSSSASMMEDGPHGASVPGTGRFQWDFETCAVCSRGGDRGEVYGCVQWNVLWKYPNRSRGWEWTLGFSSWTMRLRWGSRLPADQAYQPNAGGLTNGTHLVTVDSTSTNRNLTVWANMPLSPTNLMRRHLDRFLP